MLWRKFLSLTIYINIYHFYQCFMICTNIILSLSVNSIQYVVRWDKGQKTGNKINISTFVWSYLYYKIGSYDAIRTSCSPLIIKFLESHLYCTQKKVYSIQYINLFHIFSAIAHANCSKTYQVFASINHYIQKIFPQRAFSRIISLNSTNSPSVYHLKHAVS